MSKSVKIVLGVCLLAILGLNVYFIIVPKEKVGYINIQQVFADFSYKKELEKELKMVQTQRKNIIDSLELDLRIMAKQLQAEKENKEKIAEFQAKKESYFEKKKAFEEDYAQIVKQFDSQIIKQLNQYVKDYGEKNKYKFIYGTDGSGSLMYANPDYDITKQIIEYINKSFKGESK